MSSGTRRAGEACGQRGEGPSGRAPTGLGAGWTDQLEREGGGRVELDQPQAARAREHRGACREANAALPPHGVLPRHRAVWVRARARLEAGVAAQLRDGAVVAGAVALVDEREGLVLQLGERDPIAAG